ncbi:MAG: histidine--tRNA ligase [Candidatus Nealsonbacteria bacterium CG_4_9_14_3_um_filter_35_11]|uniref:Histidine--tRNA ligase n=2 Tax=Candidatus Nealsoniibacteriota TaxID=1817911 RepID=A0A2M7DAM0_9BACT|nr:MAG: histidine--tRNA ligase [Candidatus Nealsonbacteria bacterium CG11_big_fil_rev_8_21_14_0_20_35_11]PIV45474.1 MAG: histidine--tRNA ligase [Candidatus Nealsonbacteria bacterium CG02_land_8_20_14_3_00_34_20]PIZ89737.1 MAG: histidine--tRNA ligase [Candidatus Nealsonbacteria bacterium CG_4_10_14_0_2_um_filter_35_20]PJA84667.1 MAG: histidine--tRNA ligase [Candidatus Nealsonbacteria bacterium CG_4_9_14_3_um_filter_35_11]
MEKPKFRTPSGMHDILPQEQVFYQKIYQAAEKIFNFYNFEKIDTPILEEAEIFSKGIGESTDIVEKEMYTLRTKGRDFLALRPEGTAPVVRAYIQHGFRTLSQPVKLWYFGPYFRYERPQAGRSRQFWQFGIEVLGEKSPVIDAQVILILFDVLEELGFENLILKINSIGDENCRPYYKKALLSFLRPQRTSLCSDCQNRLKVNPLRILDCKQEKCREIISGAPQIINYLCEECHRHFKEVLEFLDELKLPYILDPYLVRGLDYYTKTVFEIGIEPKEGESQVGSLAGGGRYDKLVKLLGGVDTPACGWAAGMERIIELMKLKKKKIFSPACPQVFLAQIGSLAKRKSLKILEEFRKEKIKIAESLAKDSLNAQLNRADRLGIKYVLILGQREAIEDKIIIRDMESGQQVTIKQNKLLKEIKKRLRIKK